MTKYVLTLLLLCQFGVAQAAPDNRRAIVTHYTNLAHAVFDDAKTTAQTLLSRVEALLAEPSEKTLMAARQAWIAARIPYQQSEAFRFGNPVVDDWEGQLNSWPLDEGLIDYVDQSYAASLGNIAADMNIIANPTITLGGGAIDATTITPALLQDLHELAGNAANVTSGYHAIEFLLWGQDLNGHQAGAGERPYTDFSKGEACTNGHCERRGQYLLAATQLLVSDLAYMTQQWAAEGDNYRHELLSLPTEQALARIFYGIGSLSLGELGGERIKVALEANSTEDEHDCFSDNTHWSHYYNGLGISNVYKGEYQRIDGSWVRGPSLSQAVAASSAQADKALTAALSTTMARLQLLTQVAEHPERPQKFDMLIAPGNAQGRNLLGSILQALTNQTRAIEDAAASLGINPNAI
ncbi:imelysin family protein [Spongiibacter sp. UBA1325]|uniref:imelysin family protein n=1 Tax=Spongiibacter sp. UBA1325 TaxID=1947543 RepID=UPI00257DC1B4|nr:imelysin family protein [Spongiibacter sp. UBA1325]|tara:strand:- start:4037 stop:5266 length:1230 start_codon:yes stop_codon:yes gene_type:complete